MEQLYIETAPILRIAVVVMLLVFLAMAIDLGAGLYKAKLRGELRTSEALRRSLSKFISYEGGLMIATMADIFVHFCKFYELLGLKIMEGVPVLSLLVGIFLLVVEFMSVREKADQKTRAQQQKAAEIISKLITKDELKDMLQEILQKQSEE
jgi:uncharacterized membrane protein